MFTQITRGRPEETRGADIKQGLGMAAMDVLMRQVGQELSSQWELERVLMPWLWAEAEREG